MDTDELDVAAMDDEVSGTGRADTSGVGTLGSDT